ncbi:PREDICTED: putative F-box protein At1g50870 [Camelina sativa]|uniref:F-box protein At1g50870 n=1 Tax=Camelina sativa TaxID=90675 RepID=A0ABM1QAS0_CAMSA|nr:PREDICTED: putative F-box protein At1g50870 [Camelina sativa]
MDEQEENRTKMERETHDEEEEEEEEEYISQPDPIPLDLILEILSRLPAKSIVRFLCVSKLWSSFTTVPSFISSFASRLRRLLLTFFKKKRRFVFSLPQHENTDGSYSPVYSYEMQDANTWRRQNCYKSSASVQGVILFKRNVIWNPTTGQVLHLPKATRTLKIRGQFFLGYDPLEGKYKVLLVNSQQKHGILTLGAQESWRFIPKGETLLEKPCLKEFLVMNSDAVMDLVTTTVSTAVHSTWMCSQITWRILCLCCKLVAPFIANVTVISTPLLTS